jgi:hypothetical protein
MRNLNSTETLYVNGAGNFQNFIANSVYSALSFGAEGALMNMIARNHVTGPIIGFGILCGAGVGVVYSAVREVMYA